MEKMRTLHSAENNFNTYSGRKSRHLGLRFVSLILCLCMILPLFPGFGGLVVSSASGGPTAKEYALKRVSDANTMDDYINRLLTSDNGSRYAGRVWTDKTVVAYEDGKENKIDLDMKTDGFSGNVTFDADFLHVFSALASSQVVNEAITSPLDIIILLDMSGSMGSDLTDGTHTHANVQERISHSRIYLVLESINEAIEDLMEMNETNRVTVVGYGATAATILPLGHYEKINGQNYISVGQFTKYGKTQSEYSISDKASAAYTVEGHATLVEYDKSGNKTTRNVDNKVRNDYTQDGCTGTLIGYHTDLQAGIYKGFNNLYETLTSKEAVTYTYHSNMTGESETVPRIPVAFVMTDGGSNYALKENNSSAATGNEWNNVPIRNDVGAASDTASYKSDYTKYRAEASGVGKGGDAVILDILLTASYMKSKIENKYTKLLKEAKVLEGDEKADFQIHTISVDTPFADWQIPRIYAALDPTDYFNADPKKVEGKDSIDPSQWSQKQDVINAYQYYEKWKANGTTIIFTDSDKSRTIKFNKLANGGEVSNDDIIANINYNDSFQDIGTSNLTETFRSLMDDFDVPVFTPISGNNDADVGDSITYQDPIGEYMEIKNQSITTTPHHVDDPTIGEGTEQTYDMSMLVFGEMHGLVRAGTYDWQWNDDYMRAHKLDAGNTAFPIGWYYVDDPATAKKAEKTKTDESGSFPETSIDGKTTYKNAEEAWADGWVYRFNFTTVLQFVPITGVDPSDVHPSELPEQVKNTVYTCYRFAGSQKDRNELRRNPIYGDVPKDLVDKWEQYYNTNGRYPDSDDDYAKVSGVYRLSDIRVWVEETDDFVDEIGMITPNSGYDRSLYVNVPAAAVPTQLATVTVSGDSVLSYQTNLATDKNLDEESEEFKNYSYQSTPLRLFYAVGLEEAVIYRDDKGNQTGVNFNAISAEYIEQHTIEGQDYVWFISNYYSNTTYDDYVTDATGSRTRGDPTVTFSPSEDNRYYVFQKPLPLYAHAYKQKDGGRLTPVDRKDGTLWTSQENVTGGNGGTTWEHDAVGGGSWTGTEFMGVYKSEDDFKTAVQAVETDEKGVQHITDSHGSKYVYSEKGIVFLESDLLDRVTTDADGDGYTSDSVSFSSNDYFFILVEYYLPGTGVGTNFEGDEVEHSHDGRKVQYVVARKGSEFGSGFVSDAIDNGDMLCWTDMSGHITQPLNYLSKSDTGDYTRGEPTWEKLTKKDNDLKEYLRDTCHISDVTPEGATKSPLDEAFEYWTGIQADEVVQAALTAAKNGDSELTQEEFNTYFQFAVAARPGGIRTGDMANNIQTKGEYNAETGTFSNNLTNTSNSYYLPTVSPNSGTDDKIIINNYLGNNGYLEIANQMLHVTKMLEPPEGFTLSESELNEIFNYQIFVQGVVGERSAINTLYNEYAGVWERRLAYIDVVTDNSNLVLDNSNNRAMFVRGTDGTAEHVVPVTEGDGTSYYYADENGDTTDKKYEGGDVFYLYLPADAEGSRTRRIYQDSAYNGDDKVGTEILNKNGRTTFFKEGQREETDKDPGADNRDSFRKETTDRPAGTRSYWVMDAELIPVNTVNEFEANADADTRWSHSTTETANVLQYFTFVIRKPNDETSGTYFSSPFKTRTLYMTTTLYFGTNANTKDGTGTGKMAAADLYDGVVPSGDRPDLFGPALSNDQIARNTAEFTLKHGEGLLLTGLNNRVAYRFTEKLTDDQIEKGYALKQVSHIQQRGSQSTFLPGVQKIPIYTQDGATYGSNYATGYQNKQTENGLTWSDNPNATVKYEPFAHTNATLWECYATMGSGVSGNHHQPSGVTPEKESTQYYWTGEPNTYTEIKEPREVLTNPNCATCDEEQSDGSILHYMYKDGELVDPHYNGEATSMLRNMARYIVSPTVRFGVVGEGTTQPTTTATLPEHDYYNYSGVYSVFGNTGWFEEQVNYVNTVDPELLVITKEMVDKDGHEVVPAPNEEFEFTLTLTESATAALKGGTLYYWKGNRDLTSGGTANGMPEKAPHLYEYEKYLDGELKLAELKAETDGSYKIRLKGHEAVVIYGIPISTTYTVTETTNEDYPYVGDNKKLDETGTTDNDDDPTKTGTIEHNKDETVAMKPTTTSNREDYYNLMPPGTLIVEKKIVDDDAETVNRNFEFTVTLTPRSGGTLDKTALTAVKYDKDDKEVPGFKLEWEDVNDASGKVTGLTAKFTLKHGESVKIDGMPIGTTYNVAETGRPGYNLQHVAGNDKDEPGTDGKYVEQNDDGSVSGKITSTLTDIYLLFANGKAARVPFTGGNGLGADGYLIGGMLLIGLAFVPMMYALGKRRSYRR